MKITDVVIEYQGRGMSIGMMLSDLEHGYATYWHWHTLICNFESLYSKIRKTKEYGILLPESPMIDKKFCWELEGRISQGCYDREILKKLISIYEFLLLEDAQISIKREAESAPTQ